MWLRTSETYGFQPYLSPSDKSIESQTQTGRTPDESGAASQIQFAIALARRCSDFRQAGLSYLAVSIWRAGNANIAPANLRLGDFAALDAVGANADALGSAIHERVNGLKIRAPAPTRHVVRVRDVIAKLRAFTAKIAYLCHCLLQNP